MNVSWPALLSSVRVERWRWVALFAGSVVLYAEFGRLAASETTFRITLAACFVILVVGIWTLQAEALLYFLAAWSVALGTLRRVVTYEIVGASTGTDPLLLVQPLALVLLTAAALRAGALRDRTKLSQAVLFFSILVGIGALNPVQGSLTAGLTALIFFVPVLAFWVGRNLLTEDMLRRLLTLVAVLALPAVAYGFIQLTSGFPSWDSDWIANQGYAALDVGGTIRQFASFSSSAEYAYFLAIGAVVWIALRPARIPLPVSSACAVALIVGVFYDSTRGVIFLLVGTAGLLFAANRGAQPRTAVIIVVVAVVLLPTVVSAVGSPGTTGATGTAALVSHQVNGLANPTGSQSTLSVHLSEVIDGLRTALVQPLGEGISVVNLAGSKFAGTSQGTEQDISNVAVALGLPGLVLFLIILWQGFTRAYRVVMFRRDALTLVALGVLCVTFSQWLNGGQYAVAYLPWLVLGWIDRESTQLHVKPDAPVESAT